MRRERNRITTSPFLPFLAHLPARKPVGSRHIVSASDGLGPKSKDGEAVVSVRGKHVGNGRYGRSVGWEEGAVRPEVVQRVRLCGVAALFV